jgi:hypothetical protein
VIRCAWIDGAEPKASRVVILTERTPEALRIRHLVPCCGPRPEVGILNDQERGLALALDAGADDCSLRESALAFLTTVPALAFWHPYGFVKFPVTRDSTRRLSLHVWHPRIRRLQTPQHLCHTHGWLLESIVLAGRLVDRRFEVVSSVDGGAFLYEVEYEGDNSIARRTSNAVTTRLVEEKEVAVGVRYAIPRDDFHTTVTPETIVVTAVRNVEDPVVPGATVRSAMDPAVLRYRRGALSDSDRLAVAVDASAAIEAAS